MARATSRPASFHGLSVEQRLRRYVSAVARADWKLAQRLILSTPGGDRAEPDFVRRVDALRRLTYRVLLVALTALSWASPTPDTAAGQTKPWSPLEDPLELDREVLPQRLQAAIVLAQDRVRAAAELWAAFDAFCTEVVGRPCAVVVLAFSPREQEWLTVLVDQVKHGGLDRARIDDAVRTMQAFWERFIGSDQDPVLVLD